MNWYKYTQLKETLPYFQELSGYGDYVPNEESISQHLDELGVSIVQEIGQGDSGIAYELSNGDILKITTNNKKGKIAQYLIENPFPCIVKYKHVWKEGDLYLIIMEKLDQMVDDIPYLKNIFHIIKRILNRHNCYSSDCAYGIMNDQQYAKLFPQYIYEMIKEYFLYLKQFPIKTFDFCNIQNIGLKNGKIKFFDIT